MLSGCSNKDNIEMIIDNYEKAMNEGSYELVYDNLSTKSKEYIGKEEFINRYNNIYSAIGANNIDIKVDEKTDKSKVKISISMDTVAGELKFDELVMNIENEDKIDKISWNESLILPNMKKGDKVRVKTEKADRGKILDRNDNLLAYDGEVNTIYIHPKLFNENKEENLDKISNILDISKEKVVQTIDNKNEEHLIYLLKVSPYEEEKCSALSEIKGLTIKKELSRIYTNSDAFGNLIGYIGDISKEELEKNKTKGYDASSKMGKNGLEKVYEDKLRSKDGAHIYIERGNEEITIAKTEPQNGKDIKLSIDSNLQESIYNQMNNDKGASVALDPTTGEVLAMVSSPSYNSNTLVTYKTREVAKKYEENKNAEFQNRANDAYSPGSTIKLLTASIGLDNNVIDPTEEMNIQGLNWQKDSSWGDYKITRVKDPNKPVNLYDAIKYSDNIYFADKALKIGEDKYIEGLKKFGVGETKKFEYPMQASQISNSKKLSKEVLLADTGYGQGELLMTPLDVAMSYSALSNEGKIMTPRLVINENKQAKVYKDAIDKDNLNELIKCFSAVINDEDGSGNDAKINNVNMAGKTGTAEIKASKDDVTGTENGWFVATTIDDPKIAISMMIEKSGSKSVVPRVKNVIESYIGK